MYKVATIYDSNTFKFLIVFKTHKKGVVFTWLKLHSHVKSVL